jgi:multiple sugar transport system substrate-binding protein
MKLLSRQALAGAAAGTVLAALAAGCSSSGPSSTAAPASSTFGVSATGTVQFWARTVSKTLAQKLVSEFNASHRNLQVKLRLTSINDDVTSLATSIRAGDTPDVVGLNDIDVPTFSRNGSFMDLTAQVNKLTYKSALSPGHMGLAAYQGKQYGVPYWGDLSVLWYNKQLFQRAGLDPAKPPTTYDEILSDARAINKLGNGIHGFTFAGGCQGCLGFTVQPGIWADGSHLMNGDISSQTANITGNAALVKALTLYRNIWTQHLAPDNVRTDNGPTWGQDFVAGKVGIMPGGYGQVVNLAKPSQLGTQFMDAPLPGSSGDYSTFDGGDDFVIPTAAKNASGAWEFIQWVLQVGQQNQYPDLGATPIRTDVLTPAFSAAHPYDAVALKALAKGYAPPTLVYDQMFNQAGGPWFQMFTAAVCDGNMNAALQQGQSGLTRLTQQATP